MARGALLRGIAAARRVVNTRRDHLDTPLQTGIGPQQSVSQGNRGGDHAAVATHPVTQPLQREVNQQARTAQHLGDRQHFGPTGLAVENIVFHGQHMRRLHLPMPGVFMGMHDVKTVPCAPPGDRSEIQLVHPTWTAQGQWNPVYGHARHGAARVLGEHMDVMLLRQPLGHGDRVTLGSTTAAIEVAAQNRHAQAPGAAGAATVAGAVWCLEIGGHAGIVNRIHRNFTTTQCRTFPAPHQPRFAGKSVCR